MLFSNRPRPPYDVGHLRTLADRERDVDDAPYTDDLDLNAVSSRNDLSRLLRTVHRRADKPSLRTLEARTRRSTPPLSKTVVAEMLNGVRFPRKAVMVAFLRACGVDDGSIELWRRAWERVATSEERTARPDARQTRLNPRHALLTEGHASQPSDAGDRERAEQEHGDHTTAGNSPSGDAAEMRQLRDQITQLNSDNDRLRAQLASTRRQAAAQLRSEDAANGPRPRSPVVSRHELGAVLRALRAEKEMTIEQVAGHLLCSPTKVKRMESGFRSGTLRDVRDLCELYGVTETAQRDHLMALARASKQPGWWQEYALPFGTYVGLETDAASISEYDSDLVSGLLQVESYARAVVQAATIPPLDDATVEQRVEARIKRQVLLTQDDGPSFRCILDEGVLRRPIGGPAVMQAQLARIIELARLPRVTFQLIPLDVGAHPGLHNMFIILDFEKSTVNDVVYIDGLAGDIYLEGPADLERYRRVFSRLHSIALSAEDSIAAVVE